MEDMQQVRVAAMPRYRCHKRVRALKIKAIYPYANHEGAALHFEGFSPISVNSDYMFRHKPEVSGYFVVYDDGYQSWSPAKAFEEGYLPDDAAQVDPAQVIAALNAWHERWDDEYDGTALKDDEIKLLDLYNKHCKE